MQNSLSCCARVFKHKSWLLRWKRFSKTFMWRCNFLCCWFPFLIRSLGIWPLSGVFNLIILSVFPTFPWLVMIQRFRSVEAIWKYLVLPVGQFNFIGGLISLERSYSSTRIFKMTSPLYACPFRVWTSHAKFLHSVFFPILWLAFCILKNSRKNFGNLGNQGP